MIVKPVVRGFICTTAHPTGCIKLVDDQIDFVQQRSPLPGPRNALVIGASTGYGMASRIVSAFGAGAGTVGVFFERPSNSKRTASTGWYCAHAFDERARRAGLATHSVNGDAFSDEIKAETIEAIRSEVGNVDLVVYSLASPRRRHPRSGELFQSTLKPIGQTYRSKAADLNTDQVVEAEIEPATEDEIRQTVAVMGGEDWKMWIEALQRAGVLASRATTVAYSYIGPELTRPIYRDGTIGQAKRHLEATVKEIGELLAPSSGRALISVNKAVVTQSSAAIPAVPLYISILFDVMKEKGLHERCIEQCYRLFAEHLYSGGPVRPDAKGRLRLDDLEMRPDVQAEVAARWERVTTENLHELADVSGYKIDFLKLFGFELDGIDYEADVEIDPE